MQGLASCSWGSRMLTPKACSGPAPSMPAAMIPGPAPVITIQSARASSAAKSRARMYTGSSGQVRAEPNMVTLGMSR